MAYSQFSDGRTARHIASADVDVSRLDVHRPVGRHEVVLATKAGGVLGTVHAECALDYVTGAVSSFELNEHLSRMDDTLPLAPPPSIRAPEAARRRDGDGGGGGRKGGRDAPPFETVATRGAVELEPARWKAHPGTDTRDGPHPPHPSGKENRAVDTEGGRHRALADAREARKKKSNAATSKPASGRDRTTTPAPRDGVLEMAERLRAEMDEALDAAAAGGDDPLATAPADFSKYVAATASDSLTSWWRESAETDRPNDSTPRTSASLTASTARRFMPPDEDDDAALVADQALLDELFRQGIRDDVNDDDDVDDKNDDDAFAASSAVGALALETDSAELEADLAEARAATDAGDGGFRGDDATHRVAKSRLQNGPELELRLTAHAGLVRALERSVALDEDGRAVGDDAGDAPGGFEPLVAILKAGFARGRELGRVSLDRSGSRGAGEVRVRLPRDVAAAAVARAHAAATSARGAGPTVVVEVWTADASVDFQDDTVATSSSADVARGLFSRLMGDFAGADPGKMRGLCAVHLADLGRELERWRLADEGRNGAPGSRYEGTGYEDRSFVLNKVFEVRNPITGATGGYVGVEGRVVWGEDAQARRQR